MLNYYLQETSYQGVTQLEVEDSFREIAKIVGNECKLDRFYKNSNYLYAFIDKRTTLYDMLYGEKSRFNKELLFRVVPYLLRHFKESYGPYQSIVEFKEAINKEEAYFFLGAKFKNKREYEIETCEDYLLIREEVLRKNVSARNSTTYLPLLLKNVELTSEGYEMFSTVSRKQQICEQLMALDKYVSERMRNNNFSINDARVFGLNISDESESVHNNPKLSSMRSFYINNTLNSQFCFFHVKVGTIRIYIYPDNVNKRIYVPYIGNHLPTQLY